MPSLSTSQTTLIAFSHASLTAAGRAADPVARMFQGGRERRVAARASIFMEGDARHQVYRILEGVAVAHRMLPGGKRQVLRVVHAGDLIGLEGDDEHSYCVDAVTETVLQSTPVANLSRRLDHDTALSRRLFEIAAEKLERAEHLLFVRTRCSSSERLAQFLLDLAERSPLREGGRIVVHLAIRRADIADLLGLSIETVSRGITRFRAEGVVSLLPRALLRINDFAALERHAAEPADRSAAACTSL